MGLQGSLAKGGSHISETGVREGGGSKSEVERERKKRKQKGAQDMEMGKGNREKSERGLKE